MHLIQPENKTGERQHHPVLKHCQTKIKKTTRRNKGVNTEKTIKETQRPVKRHAYNDKKPKNAIFRLMKIILYVYNLFSRNLSFNKLRIKVFV